MPTYCYLNRKTKKLIDGIFPMADIPEFIEAEGEVCHRCREAEYASQQGARPDTWPMISRALAVHPTQREEYAKFAKENGVPTDFDPMGHPVFSDKNHRKRYAELVGATDFDGGYGDPHSD